jgi:carboxymethylenebutenolidase
MPDTDAPSLRVHPASVDLVRGGVVVIQEAMGVTGHIVGLAQRFAAAGYTAVAPDLYHRTGSPVFEGDVDFADLRPHMAALTDEQLLADIDAALEALQATGLSPEQCAVVGFCMGGRVAFLAAARRRLGAAVTFYGGGIARTRIDNMPALVGEATTLQTPWLGLFGDIDQGITVDDVEAIRSAVSAALVETQVVRYPDAGHGFFNDTRSAYDAPAAADAWTRTLDWFATHLTPAGAAQ